MTWNYMKYLYRALTDVDVSLVYHAVPETGKNVKKETKNKSRYNSEEAIMVKSSCIVCVIR